MAVLLYPPENFNERFLISIRDCMLSLDDAHPVKRWLKYVSAPKKPTPKEQERIDFASEILSSPFNLITDQKVKTQVIDLIGAAPQNTILERLFVAYLYLMIGNITRSDNVLKAIVNLPPRVAYEGFGIRQSFYHDLALRNVEKIFSKFSRHPADRRTFELLNHYILSYMNAPELLRVVNEHRSGELKGKLGLAYLELTSKGLLAYLRLDDMSSERKTKHLKDLVHYPLDLQAYWVWPFTEIETLTGDDMVTELKRLETQDPLWLIYLMEDERLADLYLKKGGAFIIPKKRQFLRSQLAGKDFMLVLFKLIELGDIDRALVLETTKFLSRE